MKNFYLSLLTLAGAFLIGNDVNASKYYTRKSGYYGQSKVAPGVLVGGAVLAGGIIAAAKMEDKKNKENEANANGKESHVFSKIASFMSFGSPRNGYYGNGYYNGGYYR